MKKLLIPALALVLASCGGTDKQTGTPVPVAENAVEYAYEPEMSTLHGTLISRVFWGPPGYGEDTTLDEREPAYILVLPKAIRLKAPKKDLSGGYNAALSAVSEIQIAPQQSISTYLNKPVTVTGTLFGAQTGHHHTEVLLDLKSIQ